MGYKNCVEKSLKIANVLQFYFYKKILYKYRKHRKLYNTINNGYIKGEYRLQYIFSSLFFYFLNFWQ